MKPSNSLALAKLKPERLALAMTTHEGRLEMRALLNGLRKTRDREQAAHDKRMAPVLEAIKNLSQALQEAEA